MRATALLCALACFAPACARPMAPPGGERDITAPRLVATVPEPLAVVEPGRRPVVFRFDERLSERGFTESLVTVSPLDSALRVDRSGAEVRVSIDGGWRPSRVYRVVLLPGVRDLFGNERREAVELVFSTGAPVGSTALAGMVTDRITGRPAAVGVVDAVDLSQGARYTAIADSSGFYSLRYLPRGEYDVRAYDDLNRNRRRDPMEPVDSGYTAAFAQATDTVALLFDVLIPDTTAPRVTGARAIDSLHVQVDLDDYVDPADLESVRAGVSTVPDISRYAVGVRIMRDDIFQAEQRAAEAEHMAADTIVVVDDTTVVRTDTVTPAPAVPVGVDEVDADLPVRVLVVRIDRPLAPGTYLLTLQAVANLHGLVGGGNATFEKSQPAPEPTPPAPPDTVPGLTPTAPPDTARIPRR